MSMDASSRAPAPPPLQLGPVRAATSPCSGTTPRSADSMTSSHSYSYSGDSSQHYYYGSPTSITSTSYSTSSTDFSWTPRKDSTSYYSGTSTPATRGQRPPLQSSSSSAVAARKVNANSYCGRHSDEFLFGGKGLGDLWRAVTKK